MYTQFQNAIPYLTTIKKVADDLKIGQFFDFGLIKKLAMNNSNPDSLMMISTMGFEKMDAYLRDQDRENLSALILFGGWIETLYLSTQILEMYPSDALVERIGEQKLVVNKIDTLLSNYSNDPYFRGLSKDFENLKASFENVEIVEEKGEVTYEELDGIKMAVDNSVTTTTVTDKVLEEIKLNTLRVRSSIIN